MVEASSRSKKSSGWRGAPGWPRVVDAPDGPLGVVDFSGKALLAQRPITLVLMMINSYSYSTNDLVFI